MVAVACKTLEAFRERQVDAVKLPFEDGRFDLMPSFDMLPPCLDWEKTAVAC